MAVARLDGPLPVPQRSIVRANLCDAYERRATTVRHPHPEPGSLPFVAV
jgi:hypothetical protein